MKILELYHWLDESIREDIRFEKELLMRMAAQDEQLLELSIKLKNVEDNSRLLNAVISKIIDSHRIKPAFPKKPIQEDSSERF
jgi:hypothetical protein